MKTLKLIALTALILLTTAQVNAAISNVPNILAAPMVLYDEGGNPLEDGDYLVTISLKDNSGNTLYEEEQQVTVTNHVAPITIGQGYAVGSSFSSPAGGLSTDTFDVTGDVTVEISVEGAHSAQEIAVLTSQPYAFISEQALSVVSESITSSSIKDGTITEADLDESFLASLQSVTVVDGEGETITAKGISVSNNISLNNSGSTNVEAVLQDLDSAITAVKNLNIANLQSQIDTNTTNISNNAGNISTNTTNITNNSTNISTNTTNIENYNTTIENYYADLTDLTNTVNSHTNTLSDHETRITDLEVRIETIPTFDVSDIPSAIKPAAYGKIYPTGSGDGKTMWCEGGYNLNQNSNVSPSTSTCQFSSSLNSSNYFVIWSQEVNACGGTNRVSPVCEVINKTESQFSFECYCSLNAAGFNGTWEEGNVISFIVYNAD